MGAGNKYYHIIITKYLPPTHRLLALRGASHVGAHIPILLTHKPLAQSHAHMS